MKFGEIVDRLWIISGELTGERSKHITANSDERILADRRALLQLGRLIADIQPLADKEKAQL